MRDVMTENKWAFVSGGGKGIGNVISEFLAKNGCNVIISYRKSKKESDDFAKKIIKEYNVKCLSIKLDSTNEKKVKAFFEQMNKENIFISYLINNAGDYLQKDIELLEVDEWLYIINNNLNANFILSKYFLIYAKEKKEGKIINIGYVNSGLPLAKTTITPYYIAKSGIVQLTQAIAKKYAQYNITANVISPGIMENSIEKPSPFPANRFGKPEEIANCVLYLLSKEADYITGTQINISGGWGL